MNCPCLECPIFLKHNKLPDGNECDKCEYHKDNVRMVTNAVYTVMNNYYCEDCQKYHSKHDFVGIPPECPDCGLSFY